MYDAFCGSLCDTLCISLCDAFCSELRTLSIFDFILFVGVGGGGHLETLSFGNFYSSDGNRKGEL
ncbi:hypothetical protein EVA_06765 [gut metagenome]|uniref:Uncharacterized protein n=1 Tax=gut metagenome TaxID=749906 RepID=J9GWU7_9ZZZZ